MKDLPSVAPSALTKNQNSDLIKYIKEVAKFPILSEKEEKDLFDLYAANKDENARRGIILSHLRLVVKIALGYKRYNVSLMDLISEGNLGLMHAFKKFDQSKKVRFATYAMLWIRSFMQDFIVRSWSTVKTNSAKIKNLLFGKNRDLLSSNDDVREISFDSFANGESSQDFFSKSAMDIDQGYEEKIIEEERLSSVSNAINNHLDIREKYILQSRFSDKEKTLDDLSKELSISKERVRQIQESAIKKIKNKIEDEK